MSENKTAKNILTGAPYTLPDTDETAVIAYSCDILAGLTRIMRDISGEALQPEDYSFLSFLP